MRISAVHSVDEFNSDWSHYEVNNLFLWRGEIVWIKQVMYLDQYWLLARYRSLLSCVWGDYKLSQISNHLHVSHSGALPAVRLDLVHGATKRCLDLDQHNTSKGDFNGISLTYPVLTLKQFPVNVVFYGTSLVGIYSLQPTTTHVCTIQYRHSCGSVNYGSHIHLYTAWVLQKTFIISGGFVRVKSNRI